MWTCLPVVAGLGDRETLSEIGARLGAVARTGSGDQRVHAALLLGASVPVFTLNAAILGTDHQEPAVLWAAELIASGRPGFHIRRSS